MRRFTMTTPSNLQGGYLLTMMRTGAGGLQSSDLILEWRIIFSADQGAGRGRAGARDAARASRPSWRFKLRRAPAKSSSKQAMARITQTESTDLASDSNSFDSGTLRKTGSFSFDVNSRRSVSKP